MPATVRVATPEDFPEMERVFAACFPSGWYFGKGYPDDFHYWVLEADGVIVGFAALDFTVRYIAHMAVMPEFRGEPTLMLWGALCDVMLYIGGNWTASCRKPMHRFLQKRQEEGQLSIVTDILGREQAGEEMREVTLKITQKS